MKNSVIIIAIVIIAVVVIGAYAAMTMMTPANNTANLTKISANGSKITVINNNKDVWAHWNLQIQNAPHKNGTQQTQYVELWIKPGENATFDLSTMLGYGETPLPQDTNLTIMGYGGLYNQTATGTGKFNTTFVGWTTNQTIPSPTSTYKTAVNAWEVDPVQTIGALPGTITGNTVNIGTSSFSGTNDQLSQNFFVLIDANGVPHFNPAGIPTLCNVIAGQ